MQRSNGAALRIATTMPRKEEFVTAVNISLGDRVAEIYLIICSLIAGRPHSF